MKTVRVIAAICFMIFAVLTAIGIYLIINDIISIYDIVNNLPYGFIRDGAFYLFGLS